jgi:hypothetical protein
MKSIVIILMLFALLGCTQQSKSSTVTLNVTEGGIFYIEIVTDVSFDGQKIGTDGKYIVEVENGEKVLVWTYANTNKLGMILNPKTERKLVNVDSDMVINIKGGKCDIERR